MSHAQLEAVLGQSKVVVCCGAGGVGKTTTSAALALAAARGGRRVLVLTIDPAKRLAQAMGIPENAAQPTSLTPELQRVAGITTGSLDAWMLNPRVVFDSLVNRLSPSPEATQRILRNRIYKALCDQVAGMQEYTAAEALYEFSTSGRYDLIVLDTPPSRNALDFLEAPRKISRFLDEKVVSLFMPSGEPSRFSLMRRAGALIGNVFEKVFGDQFFRDLQDFMGAFSGMFSVMRHHSEEVRALLSSEKATFLLVTSPEQAALQEARYFRGKLAELGLPFGGFVLNRTWVRADGLSHPNEHRPSADAPAALRDAWATLERLAEQEVALGVRDAALLAELQSELQVGRGFALAVPHLGEAVADVPGLSRLAHALVPGLVPAT